MTDGIRVNMTDKEGKSAGFEPIPPGKYLVAVTGCELAETGPNSKQAGRPYFKLEYTVQEGQYENRKIWDNVMLFDGALYSISNMLKAVDVPITLDSSSANFQVPGYEPNSIPGPEWWMGKQFIVRTKMGKETKTADGKTYAPRAEVSSYSSIKGVSAATLSTGAPKKTSQLP